MQRFKAVAKSDVICKIPWIELQKIVGHDFLKLHKLVLFVSYQKWNLIKHKFRQHKKLLPKTFCNSTYTFSYNFKLLPKVIGFEEKTIEIF